MTLSVYEMHFIIQFDLINLNRQLFQNEEGKWIEGEFINIRKEGHSSQYYIYRELIKLRTKLIND